MAADEAAARAAPTIDAHEASAALDRARAEAPGAGREELEALMDDFVARHAGRPRQRTAAWLAGKATSIGGSELAALMGYNPYDKFNDIVAAKAGLKPRDGGSVPCWWGTMFESAIERFVEIDCGTRLAGTDISVPAPAGSGLEGLHANSPDGFAVLDLYREDDGGGWAVRWTDAATRAAAAGRDARRVVVLAEFKCPYRRQPKGAVPKHYRPQLWSGLALAPVAALAMFVDAVFRKCALWNLGPSAGYDRGYHREREVARWTTPVAWGLTAVYAPRMDAPRAGAGAAAAAADAADADAVGAAGDAGDPAYAAWQISYEYFGRAPESPAAAARAGRAFAPDPVDFGDAKAGAFDAMMRHVDAGGFVASHVGPCFPDGRGAALGTPRAVGAAVGAARAAAPARHYLLGVIPWKLLEVDYVFEARRPGFLAEVGPAVRECLALAAGLRAAPDPARAFRARQTASAGAAARAAPPPDISPEQLQDFFDSL